MSEHVSTCVHMRVTPIIWYSQQTLFTFLLLLLLLLFLQLVDLPVVPGVGSGGSAVAGGEEEEGSGGAEKWVYDVAGGVAGQESKCGGVKGMGGVVGNMTGENRVESEEEEEGVGSEEKEEGVWSDGEEKGVGSEEEEEESEGEGVMDDTVGGDTPKVLVRKAGKEELEKERQLPKEVLEKLQQQRREMAAVVGSTRVSNGPLHRGPMHYHSEYAVATRHLGMTLRDVERHH